MVNITCGVPQGSILGPIIFLIHVNDINNSTQIKVLSFADDTTVAISSPNISNLYCTMNQELEKLNDWFRANRLCISVEKNPNIFSFDRQLPSLEMLMSVYT